MAIINASRSRSSQFQLRFLSENIFSWAVSKLFAWRKISLLLVGAKWQKTRSRKRFFLRVVGMLDVIQYIMLQGPCVQQAIRDTPGCAADHRTVQFVESLLKTKE